MTLKDFTPVLEPTQSPARGRTPPLLEFFIKDSLRLTTILTIGALLQTVVIALLPARYALLPVALLAGRSLINTILEARTPTTNHFINDIIRGRVTAQLPETTDASSTQQRPVFTRHFGNRASAHPLVVFHLGARINHPLGLLAPGARELGEHFQAMVSSLHARRDDYGMLSITNWRGQERAANNAIMIIAYFRSVEDLNRFAHDEVHRRGWDWYHEFVRETGHRHLGLFHETFVSREGGYETIYVDTAPTLLGAANVGVSMKDGSKEQEGWVRPLVSADHPALRSQAKRLGLTLNMKD